MSVQQEHPVMLYQHPVPSAQMGFTNQQVDLHLVFSVQLGLIL